MQNYHEKLGQAVSQFHTLEFLLRNFLFIKSNHQNTNSKLPIDLYKLNPGESTPVTEFTNYDTSQKLIHKTNVIFTNCNLPPFDTSIVDIRDAVAHGRVATLRKTSDRFLLKFENPKKETHVKLSHKFELTESFFNSINKKLKDYINILSEVSV